MRAIIIGCSLLLSGIALVAAAPDKLGNAPQAKRPQAATVSEPLAIPVATFGVRPADAAPRSTSVALTAAQCTELGGEVVRGDDIAGNCGLKAYCRAFGQNGDVHRVCLSND